VIQGGYYIREAEANHMEPHVVLRVGDIIYMKLEDNGNGWLCAEGHLGDNVYVSADPEDFHNGLWEVHAQNQYSSYNEYEEAVITQRLRSDFVDDEEDLLALHFGGIDPINNKVFDPHVVELTRQLRRAALNEQKLNERAMNTKIGTPVTFGDAIQLRHISSRKFLSVSPSQLAVQERENMRVLNIRNGNALSAINFSPSDIDNSGGNHISNNTEVYVKIHEKPGEFLRGAKARETKADESNQTKSNINSPITQAKRGEANCSLEKTRWSVNVYQSVYESASKNICAGKLVCLSDAETRSNLTVSISTTGNTNIFFTKKNSNVSNGVSSGLDSLPDSATTAGTGAGTGAGTSTSKIKGGNVSKDIQVVLQPRVGENHVNDLWRIEKRTIVRGGSVRLNTDFVVFVHLSSNLYLHCRSTDGALSLVTDRNRATEFDLKSINISGKQNGGEVLYEGSRVTMSTISEFGKKVGIGSSPLYVSVNTKKIKSTSELHIQPDLSAAITLAVSNSTQTQLGSDVYFGIESCRCLHKFRYIASEVTKDDAFDSHRMIAASQAFQNALSCLSQIVSWLMFTGQKGNQNQNGPTNFNPTHIDQAFEIAPSTIESCRARQTMMREQGVLDILIELLNDCLENKFNHIRVAASETRRTQPIKNVEDAVSVSRKMSAKKSPREATNTKNNLLLKKQAQNSKNLSNSFLSRAFSFTGMGNSGRDIDNDTGKGEVVARKSIVEAMIEYIKPSTIIADSKKGYGYKKKKIKTPKAPKAKKSKGSDSDSGSEKSTASNSNSGSDSDSDSDTSSSSSSSSSDSDNDDDFNDGTMQSTPNSMLMKTKMQTSSRRMSATTGTMKQTIIKEGITVGANGELILPIEMKGKSPGSKESISNSKYDDTRKIRKQNVALDLAESLLQAVALCIYDHGANQLHVSPHMPILLKHVNTQAYAVYCLQELFKDNQAILQTKIRQIEINIFVNLLSQSEMNVPFLKLLQSTCTCPHGVDSTQRMVAVSLFGVPDSSSDIVWNPTSSTNDGLTVTDANAAPSDALKALTISGETGTNTDNQAIVGVGVGVGVGVDNVKNVTVTDQSVMTIKMFSDGDALVNVRTTWIKHGVYSYIPPRGSNELNEEDVLGFKLLLNGLPETFVSWKSNNKAKSMFKLFGVHDQIPFHVVSQAYEKSFSSMIRMKEVAQDSRSSLKSDTARRISSMGDPRNLNKVVNASLNNDQGQKERKMRATNFLRKGKKKSHGNDADGVNDSFSGMTANDEYKCVVAEYLLTELYLVADLCLDRNYVAIQILENSFPYDMLLTELRKPNVQPAFKAPICRILRCLWIDREPQTEAVFPRLIRSSKRTEEDINGFTKHHKGSPYAFCLLQQTISDYFHQIHGDVFDELSRELSELTLMLMKFGFYSHLDHLSDITEPLISILDYNNVLKGNPSSSSSGNDNTKGKGGTNMNTNVSPNKSDSRNRRPSDIGKNNNKEIEMFSSWNQNNSMSMSLDTIGNAGDGTMRDYTPRGEDDTKKSTISAIYDGLMTFNSYFPWSSASAYDSKIIPSKSKMQLLADDYDSGDDDEYGDTKDRNKTSYKTQRQIEQMKRRDEVNEKYAHMWESAYIVWTDTPTGLIFVMSVVCLTVSVSMLQLVSSNLTQDRINLFDSIDLFCSIFFLIELYMRGYCISRTQGILTGGLFKYFMNPLNFLDLLLVILDIVLYAVGVDGGAGVGAARAGKIIKGVRFARLLRVVKVLRIMSYLKTKNKGKDVWIAPLRFSEANINKYKTMTTVLQTLRVVYNRIQDNSLETTIKAFQAWVELSKEGEEVDPSIVIKQFMSNDDGLGLIPENFENVLADVILYDDKDLTNEALSLLMLHLNRRTILLALAKDIQIVYSPKVEMKQSEAKILLQEMRRAAEMYEIWQNLSIPENDEKARKLSEWIRLLSNMLKKQENDNTLAIKSEFIPDDEVQHLLRNMDAMNCFMTVLEALYDGGRDELSDTIRKIMRSTMQMICLFVQNNERNQQLAYQHFRFFVEVVDDDIASASVLQATLKGNPELVKLCHKRYVEEFAQKIFTRGQKPEYMTVFCAMTDESHSGDSGMKSVQNNISRFLTSREWQTRILLWCCTAGSNAYAQRSYAMSQFPDADDRCQPLEELSSDLQYHINMLHVLAQCNLGPKLQAIYQLDDLVHAIIDKHTIFYVKIALGRCLEQLICNGADNYVCAEYMWLFFDDIVIYLNDVTISLTTLLRRPINTGVVNKKKQIGEYLEICLTIVTVFFAILDLSVFGDIVDHDLNVKRTQRTESMAQLVIKKLYTAIRSFVDKHGFHLGMHLKERCNFALISICRHSDDLNFEINRNNDRIMMNKKARGSVTLADVQQLQLRHKFIEFTTSLHDKATNDHKDSILFFTSIPSIADEKSNSDMRIEPFIGKLVAHIRSCISSNQNSHTLTKNYDESLWFLRTLRRLFEEQLGVSVEESIDLDLNAVKDDDKTEFWRSMYNSCGVVELCLDFIAIGIDTKLVLEAINLLIVLLAKRNGATELQISTYRYMRDKDSTLFFLQIKEIFTQLNLWYQKEAENGENSELDNIDKESNEYVIILPDENSIFTLLQLMCEGDYLPIKIYMKEQESNSQQVVIPILLGQTLDFLSRRESQLFTHVTIDIVKTIRKLLHGPCRENQNCIILNTEVLVSLNRLIRLSRPKGAFLTASWNYDIEQLKECVIDTLRSMIEGFFKDNVVFDRLLSSIEFNVLSLLLMPAEEDGEDVMEFGFTKMESKYLTLLNSLETPSYFEGLHDFCLVKAREAIRFVDVKWQNSTHRIYFNVPTIVEDLASDYMTNFDGDGASQEDKLYNFLITIKALYVEAKHQQVVKQYGLSWLWSRKTYLSIGLFLVGSVLNFLILFYYHRNSAGEIHLGGSEEDDVKLVISILMFANILMVVMMVILYFTVRLPASFKTHLANGESVMKSLFLMLLEPLPWWYLIVLYCSIVGYMKDSIYCIVFMLEWIVIDSTSRQLLQAVYYPFKQLVATLIILSIVIHIFSGIYFSVYDVEMKNNHVEPIYDLWSALKMSLSYGLRGEYGIDHEFNTTLTSRIALDLAFYFIVLATLRHIFFAIIVETFGQLRELKNERDEMAHHVCFICGVSRHDFEKIDSPISFHHHREHTHSIESYVYFVFGLLEQSTHEDLGIETHIRRCIATKDITWIPIGLDHVAYARDVKAHQPSNSDDVGTSGRIKKVSNSSDDLSSPGLSLSRSDSGQHGQILENDIGMGMNDENGDDEVKQYQVQCNGGGNGGVVGGNNSSSNDILRAIQGLTSQITTIIKRIDSLEEAPINSSSSGGGKYNGGGTTEYAMRMPAGGGRRDMSPGRFPQRSTSSSRNQLRGPSETSLRGTLPPLGAISATAPNAASVLNIAGLHNNDNDNDNGVGIVGRSDDDTRSL
jgi:hypothetical protein